MKVSVIVPTYSPGEGLDRVVGSLDAQTMDQADFEVVLVDDGSPDNTFARLQELASERPNYVVRQIDNSGWPSRPRNVGLDLARGEDVVFMDHDDYLYPDGLRAAHAYAVAQRADVLSAKETRTSDWFAYEGVFGADVPADRPKTPAHYGPWTTHKLFRRAFLVEHGIRFREGVRVLFEDVLVGISAYTHAERVAVLSSVPFYQWVHVPGHNHSGTYGTDGAEYVRSIEAMFDHAEAEAGGTDFAEWVARYQYRVRVLGQLLGPALLRREDEDRDEVVALVQRLIADRVPPAFDVGLAPVAAARAALARGGTADDVVALARADQGVRPKPVTTEVRWDDDGVLHVDVRVRWEDGDAGALRLRRDGDRLLRTFPDGPPAHLPESLLDVTDAVGAATAHLTITSRKGKVGWPVASTAQSSVVPLDEDHVTVETQVSGTVRFDGPELGRPLEPGIWDIACRAAVMGYGGHVHVVHEGKPRVLGRGATVTTAYSTASGRLSVDVGGDAVSVLSFTTCDREAAATTRRGRGVQLEVPFDGAVVTGEAELSATAVLRPRDGSETRRTPSTVRVDGDGILLRALLDPPRGHHELRVRTPGRRKAVTVPVQIVVGRLRRTAVRALR
ncbi:glycosyltransferase family 2 protein [Mumia quercus]|uniref:glycosyltransferase family 2 protein n=1 Tax=Mumia quercus TaxID=2976125 RepID=UPI0021D0DCBF|nr:glycosyltransferase family A protein [Mumia quercus]